MLHIGALHSCDKVELNHTQNWPIRDYRFRDKLRKDKKISILSQRVVTISTLRYRTRCLQYAAGSNFFGDENSVHVNNFGRLYIHNKVENHLAVNGTKVVGCSLANLRVAVTHPLK